eukprot:3803856-Amphidinium_carterae.1
MRPEQMLNHVHAFWSQYWCQREGLPVTELQHHCPRRPVQPLPRITGSMVNYAISLQKASKASGPDGWRAEELHLCDDHAYEALASLFNRCERLPILRHVFMNVVPHSIVGGRPQQTILHHISQLMMSLFVHTSMDGVAAGAHCDLTKAYVLNVSLHALPISLISPAVKHV